MAARGPQNGSQGAQNGQQSPERGLPLGFWCSCYLLQNKIFNLSTPSIGKVDDGGNEKIRTFIVATNIVASQPPKRQPLVPIIYMIRTM